MRTCTLLTLVVFLLLGQAAVAAGGSYTIHGVLLGFDGQPIAGYPMCITPLKPKTGIDPENAFYRIPDYDNHLTVTDGQGRFVMTNVQDYPQVKHHKYRIWGGNLANDARRRHPYVRATYTVDLSTAASDELFIVIKSEPASALRVLARDVNGRPYTGTISLGLASGPHSYNRTVEVENGEAFLSALPVGNAQQMGRVVILPDKSSEATFLRLGVSAEKSESMGLLTEGAILDRSVQFLPFTTVTVEVTLPFASE